MLKIKNRNIYVWLAILLVISLSLFVFSVIYQDTLPKIIEEINNSSIGAILTAIITVLLLTQQSTGEEIKERNVRVFEEKSNRFKVFIDRLWVVWEDRVVTLEELNELTQIVSKEIVLYTNPDTVGIILDNLGKISDAIHPGQSDYADR